MNREIAGKIYALQQRTWEQETFRALAKEHEQKNRQFLEMTDTLSPGQRDVMYDYLGLMAEIHNTMLAYIVNEWEIPGI